MKEPASLQIGLHGKLEVLINQIVIDIQPNRDAVGKTSITTTDPKATPGLTFSPGPDPVGGLAVIFGFP